MTHVPNIALPQAQRQSLTSRQLALVFRLVEIAFELGPRATDAAGRRDLFARIADLVQNYDTYSAQEIERLNRKVIELLGNQRPVYNMQNKEERL